MENNSPLEEKFSKIFTACIIANIPLIAQAVVAELNKQPKPVHTVTRQEAARILNMSLPTIDKLINDGTIRAKKLGRKVVIDSAEIQNLIESGEVRNLKYRRN